MTKFTSPLDRVRVAAPCSADWNRMMGDERVRFCHQCSKNVYNLSSMTKREAEALITRAEGRLCVRYYQRGDGSILTSNCPVGLRHLKRRASRSARAVASAVLSFFAGLGLYAGLRRDDPVIMGTMPIQGYSFVETGMTETTVTTGEALGAATVMGEPVIGKVALDGEWVEGRMEVSPLPLNRVEPVKTKQSRR